MFEILIAEVYEGGICSNHALAESSHLVALVLAAVIMQPLSQKD
jgi:hypothetical protein